MNNVARWQAVLDRDRQADGRFVYAVQSTGVFCRPSCPSRRPTRSRVVFFDTPAAAERGGFRPCKRCHPATVHGDPWVPKIARACVYLAKASGHPPLAVLARRLGGSPSHVQRNFKRLVGLSPREFAAACRLTKMKRFLRSGNDVTTALLEAGYGSSSRFYERAASRLGMSPVRYRKGAPDMEIRYTVVNSAVGSLLVAATGRGVCSVALGESGDALMTALQQEYPRARLSRDRDGLSGCVSEIVRYLAGRTARPDLPLDVRATAFQWQVWNALAAIPRGATRTYGTIASDIGRPGSARAVARACASNPVALAIPCHRVVPAGGGTGGYRWGSSRKQALLEREQKRIT